MKLSRFWGSVQNALSGIHNQYVVCRPDKRSASDIIALGY
ncbi:hypothetical protein HMPREF1588_02029 [Escherichia coli 110957]|nr:hypothetical protein HMPREF1588_02029 [Escherichia coli 110957]